MNKPLIHPNWAVPPMTITEGFSLEMTAKDVEALQLAAPHIPKDTPLSVTFLPGENIEARVSATLVVRQLGFEPMPHFSARRILSQDDFAGYLGRVVKEADASRCFIVAGDPAEPLGPYHDTLAMIRTGAFEQAGVKAIGIGGHPEGHPVMSKDQCWQALADKVSEIEARGMAALIVTQFAFDSQAVLDWVAELRHRGIDTPVRIGVPGPASIKALLRFASRCGVGASTAVMKKYGVSITNLLGNAGPDKLVDALHEGLNESHGKVRLHFYPFGGLLNTVRWIEGYANK